MKNIDVIVLANSVTEKLIRMTRRTIISMKDSEDDFNFNFILVESGADHSKDYQDIVDTYIRPNENFNYNRFINHTKNHLKGDWVVISNNDVGYERGWLTEIMKVHEARPDILSFSPKDPALYMKYFDGHFLGHKETYWESYSVTEAVMGWCLVIRKDAFDKISPFDEIFDMYYQDNDYTEMLKLNAIKHALVRHSIVCHLETINIPKLNDYKMRKMVVDELKFNKKWNR